MCFLHHHVLDLGDFPQSIIYLRVPLGRRDGKTPTTRVGQPPGGAQRKANMARKPTKGASDHGGAVIAGGYVEM